MAARSSAPAPKTILLVWWVAWAVILAGLVVLYFALGRRPVEAARPEDTFINLVGMVPLFVSIVIRWLVLPRYQDLTRALPLFLVGLALAESCGILGLFLGGPYRDDVFVLGVLGVVQYIPLFARRLQEPKAQGFIPNN